MKGRDFQRGVRAGMLIGMEATARALENAKHTDAAVLVRQAIKAHIERYPELAGFADAKPVSA